MGLIGLIPAAGKGVRLGLPYPKELYPVIRDNRYKPVAQFVLENLTVAGVQHMVFVINETKHQLIGYFGNGNRFGCHISYVVQEQSNHARIGLAHALDSAYHLVRNKIVCFGMADTIMTPRNVFRRMLEGAKGDVVLGLYRTEHPERFDMVQVDEDGCALQVINKPPQSDLQYMWGCIVWRPPFTEHLHACVQKRMGLADVLTLAIREGMRVDTVLIEDGSYADLGTYDEILKLYGR